MRLLLVEDDSMIGAAAQQGLRHEGYTVDWVRDGKEAGLAIANGVYDLVLLDLGLPRRDGLSLLRELRAKGNEVPVLVVTARDAVADRIAGLDAGADATSSSRSTWTSFRRACALCCGAAPDAGARRFASATSRSTPPRAR